MIQGEIEPGTLKLERSGGLPEMAGPLDPGIVATSDATLGRILLGRPSQARDQLDYATRRAAASKHPATIVHVALGGIRDGAVLLDDELVERNAAILAALPMQFQERWLAFREIAAGWLEIRHGDSEGADRIQRARLALFGLGMRGYQSLFAALVATWLLRAGRHDETSAMLDEGLTLIGETGERWCEAELHRLHGELHLVRAARQQRKPKLPLQLAGEAEACFRRALEVARAQGAKWRELRTAVSLAGLLVESDRSAEARRLLSDAHGAFQGEPDLPDLRAARELLATLDAR